MIANLTHNAFDLSLSRNFTYDPVHLIFPPEHRKMSDDRKYRQRGYMDHDREPQRPRSQAPKQSPPRDREGPRSPKMMAFNEAVKCAMCGAKASPNIGLESSCP